MVLYLAGCSGVTRHNQSILPCLEGKSPVNMDENDKFSGDLIFRNNEKGEIVAFNGETHEITPLFRVENGEFWLASPLSWDRKSLVIYPYPSNVSNDGFLSMSIISFQGIAKQVKIPLSMPDPKKTYSWTASNWGNEEYLQAVFFEQGNTGDEISEIVLLNPFKQEVQTFKDFVKTTNRGEGEDGYLLSPDLTRALFINNQYYLTLYDVARQNELWTYTKDDGAMMILGSSDLRDTIWSKSSDLLLVPAPLAQDTGKGTVILFVDRDGSIVNSISFENYQHGFSWNSNENLLAFYGYECDLVGCTTNYKSVIRVLNVDQNVVTDVCSLESVLKVVE